MNLNYRFRLVAVAFLLLGFASNAQNSSVSIGTTGTNSSAVLWLDSPGQNQGLIIPVGNRTNVATPAKGMLIFDTNQVYAYDGAAWNTVGGTGSGSTYSLSYNASTKVITLNPNSSGTATIDISTTALSGGDLGGTLATPNVTGIQGKSITLPNSGVQYLSYDVTQAKWVFQTPSGSLPTAGANQILTSNASSVPTWASTIPGSQVTPNFGAQNISTTGTLSSGATTVTGLTVSGATTSLNNKTYTWPNNPTLTAGTFLQTNATGNLSWAPAGGALPVLTNNQLLSNNGVTNLGVTVGGDLTYSVSGTTGSFTIAKLQGQAYTFPASNLTAGVLTNPGTGALTWSPVTGFLTSTLPSGDIIVGNGSGIATPTIMNGDAGIDNTGKVTIANGAISSAKILDGTITDADINASGITTAGKVSGSAITSGTIGGSTVINTSGDIVTTGGNLSIFGTTTLGGIKYTWPTTLLAAPAKYLSTDPAGNLNWTTVPSPFSTTNVIPKGDGTGLTSSLLFDDGTNVGIGVPAPSSKLEVAGNIINSNPSQGYLGLTGDLPGYSASVYPTLKTNSSYMYFSVAGKYSGYLGGTDATFGLNDAATTANVFFHTNGDSYLNGGNVGIGTTAPGTLLDVNGNTFLRGGFIGLGGATTAIGSAGLVLRDDNGAAYGGMYIHTPSTGGLPFYGYTNGTSSCWTYLDGANFTWRHSYGLSLTSTGTFYVPTLTKGAGTFKIDHPQDPENKFLSHSFVESPDMMNVYNGNIITEANGEAVVSLPEYFESLNKDFRYQLTVIGDFAQAIVYKKIANNKFVIKTDKPNIEVSWQVTGIRKDPFAEQNRVVPETLKSPTEKGKYLNPEAYGLPKSKGINYTEDRPNQ